MIVPENPVTEREKEMLQIVTEECAEVIQAISKMVRFGKDNMSPVWFPGQIRRNNTENLSTEIGQLIALLKIIQDEGMIDDDIVSKAADEKFDALKKYSNIYE